MEPPIKDSLTISSPADDPTEEQKYRNYSETVFQFGKKKLFRINSQLCTIAQIVAETTHKNIRIPTDKAFANCCWCFISKFIK